VASLSASPKAVRQCSNRRMPKLGLASRAEATSATAAFCAMSANDRPLRQRPPAKAPNSQRLDPPHRAASRAWHSSFYRPT
jgi:hypothetical protein